jgi:RimJ/RimL family protein N-acetyltransferase
MDCAIEALCARFDAATLWVLADNRRARRFYELAGWRPDGASKRGEIGGRELTELRYRKSM